MKTSIFIFHPNLKEGSKVNKALADAAEAAGLEVRDMYALYPDFQVNTKEEQALLEGTDRIILQFPMYWYSTPALLQQWLDTILEYGWAYGSEGNALRGKEIFLAVTQGAAAEDYTPEGRFHVTNEELLKPLETIRYHTGLDFKKPFIISGTLNLSDQELTQAVQAYVERLKSGA